MSYQHSFNPAEPPCASHVVSRINDETDCTCEAAKVNWLADPPCVEVTLAAEATGDDLVAVQAIVDDPDPPGETVAGAISRCVRDCVVHFVVQLETTTADVEYPPASGKKFSAKLGDIPFWTALHSVKDDINYPRKVRTKDETDYHSLANPSDVSGLYAGIRDTVLGQVDLRDAAIELVIAATTIAEAEAGRDTYTGGASYS